MKILQILPSLEVGGVERGVIDLARALKDTSDEIVVISSGGKLVSDLQKMGVTHYTLPVHRKSLGSLWLIGKITEIIRKEAIDIVHARSRVPAWLAWVAAWQTGKPFITTCHGYYSKHLLSNVMGWGKFVIVISRVVGRHMIDDFGVSPERIRLIHRGIDLSEFQMTKTSRGPRDIHRVINVGRLSPIKGQVEFLRAVHLLRKKIPRLEVLLVGAEGKGKTKYTEEIQSTVRQLGLENCVQMMGNRRDVSELIASCDLLVLSTLVPEAFGRVVVEAGAVGVPVVATRVGGVLDIIDEGENGKLTPPGDIQAMADAMADILLNPVKAQAMARKLRSKVENQFPLEQMVQKTLAVYREAMKSKKILVIKLGAMGDLILGTPSFRMLRQRFPDAKISLLVDKRLAPVISPCPYLNEIIPIDRKKLHRLPYLLKLAKKLRQEGFDVSVDLQNSKWTHLLAALALIHERFGFRRGKLGFFINRHDQNFEMADSPVRHQFRILSKLGVTQLDEKLELWPEAEVQQKVDRILQEWGVNGNASFIGLAIGASKAWPTKRWPPEYYRDLAIKLSKEGHRILLIGSSEDVDQAGVLNELKGESFLNLLGKSTLPEMICLIKRLRVLVTGDTAPLHVAAAMDIPFVTLFGPTDPKRHAPPSSQGIILNRRLECQPCYEGSCRQPETLACLKKISVEEVYDAVKRQLNS